MSIAKNLLEHRFPKRKPAVQFLLMSCREVGLADAEIAELCKTSFIEARDLDAFIQSAKERDGAAKHLKALGAPVKSQYLPAPTLRKKFFAFLRPATE